MRYVMLTWVDPDDAAAWEQWKDADVQADLGRHGEWFGKHRDRIVGGEELDYPRTVKEIRPGRQSGDVVVVDGPYVESQGVPRRLHRARGCRLGRGSGDRLRVAVAEQPATRHGHRAEGVREGLTDQG